MTTVELPLVQEWTPEVLEGLSEEYRYEVYDGSLLVMSAAMQAWHARVQMRLAMVLAGRGAEALIEQGVILGPGQTRTCDVGVFVRPPRGDRAYHPASAFALVVEVVSPDSEHRDRVRKPDDYASAGIPEFWLVEQAADGEAVVHQHRLTSGGVYGEVAVTPLTELEAG